MKKTISAIIVILIFALGWYSNLAVGLITNSENPYFAIQSNERISPSDIINTKQIIILEDRIIINQPGITWASYANTNSMDPVLDEDSNGFEIVPESENQISVGDIIAYEPTWNEGLVIHRIIEIGYDEQGWYAILKGDNNPIQDPGKVRFEQVKYLLIGIIY